MLTTIPAYARPAVDAFIKTGTGPGLDKRVELDPQQAAQEIQGTKDEFTRWSKMDESPDDKWSGTPGEVYLDVPQWQGHQEVSYQGDANNGSLVFVDETPNEHYSARWTSAIHATPDGIDILSVAHSANSDWGLGPTITHLDPKTGTGYELYSEKR